MTIGWENFRFKKAVKHLARIFLGHETRLRLRVNTLLTPMRLNGFTLL